MRIAVALFLLVASTSRSFAAQTSQPAPSQLRGRIVDAKSGIGLGRVTITVRKKGTELVVARASALSDGAFVVSGLEPGLYAVRATLIGFAPATRDIDVARSPVTDAGIIEMSAVATTIEGVSVTEERATLTIASDRNAYVAKSVAPGAGNASEVLDAVPSVQVDADGKVSLRGNENVTVQIDGRPTPLTRPQLASYLKSLPASIVERVEVIPNPSAKQDPDGMAGIINLVLKQQVDLGTSLGVNAGLSSADRYNVSGTFGYQRGRFTTFATAGTSEDTRAVVGLNDRERYGGSHRLLWTTEEDIESAASNGGRNAGVTTDVKLRPSLVLSNAIMVNRHTSGDESLNAFAERDGGRALTDRYDRPRVDRAQGWMVDYYTTLKRAFQPGKHELSGELRINRAKDEDRLTLWRQAPGGSLALSSSRREAERNDTDARSTQVSAQLDYTRAVGKRVKLESGYKTAARWIDRDFEAARDSLGADAWVPSPRSNALSFAEIVHATYTMATLNAGSLEVQTGLRAERATRDFSLGNTASAYRRVANSVFPSAGIVYSATPATQLKASYSRRIRRPATTELNPFPAFWDAQNAFIGNPNLDPEYTDAVELSVSRSARLGMLQVSPFYRRTGNAIRIEVNTADVIDGRDVTSLTLRNMAASTSWGADVTGSLRLGRRFNSLAGANVFKMVADGGALTSLSSSAVSWSARWNGSFEPAKSVMLQAAYFYRAPLRVPRFQFASFQTLNVSAKKSFARDNASVTLRVTDPFNTGIFRGRGGDANVVQLTERSMGMRQAFLAFQYAYGRPPQVREAKRDQDGAPGFVPPP